MCWRGTEAYHFDLKLPQNCAAKGLLTCWIEHSNSSGQMIVLRAALNVFDNLDRGALRIRQMFAAEIIRLETESHHHRVCKSFCQTFCISSRRSDHWPEQWQVPETHVLACYASLPLGFKTAPEALFERILQLSVTH